MCGISGMFASPDEAVIQRMISILSHRGPDGNGIWQDSEIALGHTRLSIVDLVGSSQPIIGNNGTVLIANGEIYNHLDYKLWKKNSHILVLINHSISKNKHILRVF